LANSKRKTILNYLRDTVLPKIVTASGYNTSVQTIQRGLKEIDALPVSGFPAVFVARSTENRENISIGGGLFQSKMSVVIVGYVKNESGTSGLMEQVDDLIEDVTKAIETDLTLGGKANWSEIKSVASDDGDMMPYAAFALTLEVTYTIEGATP
jgi:ABC-type iron transport system FetAB permease component